VDYFVLYFAITITLGMLAGLLLAKDEFYDGISVMEILFLCWVHMGFGVILGIFSPFILVIVVLHNIKVVDGWPTWKPGFSLLNWKQGVKEYLGSLG